MKIFLIRHGETTGDVEDRYGGGGYDDALTQKGIEQVTDTAQQLKDKGIQIIFSSPLVRASQSADILAPIIGCTIEYVEPLKERIKGVIQGLTKQEALEKYPDVVALHDDFQNTLPGGESFEDFKKRVVESFIQITHCSYDTVAVVTHGGPIMRILSHLGLDVPEKIHDAQYFEIDI